MTKHRCYAKSAALLAALAMSGCGPDDLTTEVSPAAANVEAAAPLPRPQAASEPMLTPDGFGEVRVGMTEAEALAAGLKRPTDGLPVEPACHWLWFDEPDVLAMVENGKVTRITAHLKAKAKSDKGLGIGSTKGEVEAAYGPSVEVEPHKYLDSPAQYLTWWRVKGERGIRYETDQRGVVTEVHAGSASIRYIEGCS